VSDEHDEYGPCPKGSGLPMRCCPGCIEEATKRQVAPPVLKDEGTE
jgi:hypothetical protein